MSIRTPRKTPKDTPVFTSQGLQGPLQFTIQQMRQDSCLVIHKWLKSNDDIFKNGHLVIPLCVYGVDVMQVPFYSNLVIKLVASQGIS